VFDDLKRGQVELEREDLMLVDFFEGADLLIHDGQYTQEEYPAHLGWGHSFYEFALEMAMQGHVKRLMFFHHDPDRTDADLDKQLEKMQTLAKARGSAMEISAACEGLEIQLP
jgi:ribonuclease BN (tRNA processing enzyme)